MESGRVWRIVCFGLAFLLLSLAIQVTMILRYTFAADALEAETQALAESRSGRSFSFTVTAGALFDARLESGGRAELDGRLRKRAVARDPGHLQRADRAEP